LEAILIATDTSMEDAMHLSRYEMEFWKKIFSTHCWRYSRRRVEWSMRNSSFKLVLNIYYSLNFILCTYQRESRSKRLQCRRMIRYEVEKKSNLVISTLWKLM